VKKAQDKESALKAANEQIIRFIAKEPPSDADSENGAF
jgi:hypothetical protein